MVKHFFNFIKIEHTLFSLPIVFSGTFLALIGQGAENSITFKQFFWILIAVLTARSVGFGLNRIIDKDIDKENPRTKMREIPSGLIPLKFACIFVIVSSILFMFSAKMLSNLCLILAPIPLILFLIYPFLKRWTLFSHLGLGIAWGIAPLGGWLAVSPQLHPIIHLAPALLLSGFCIFWVAGFDVLYALLDEAFDREKGLRSMPAVLGLKNALEISEIAHFIAFLFLGTLVQLYLPHKVSFILLGAVGLLFILSHWKVQFQGLSPSTIDFAFFKVNAALGFVVFLLIVFPVVSQ